jgi:hypothetical protein
VEDGPDLEGTADVVRGVENGEAIGGVASVDV